MGVAKGAGGRGEGQGVLGMQAHPPQIEYQENLLSLWMCFSFYCYANFLHQKCCFQTKNSNIFCENGKPPALPLSIQCLKTKPRL